MLATPPISICSGASYRIVDVDGGLLQGWDQSAGQTTFTLDVAGAPYRVIGEGSVLVDTARVHEKGLTSRGQDIRVWTIQHHPDGGFTATHVTAY